MRADDGDRRAVRDALGEPDDDVAMVDQADVCECARVDREEGKGSPHPGAEGDAPGDHRQDGGHHEARDEAGSHQIVDGVCRAHAQRVHLLGDHHGADLRGDAGADPGGEQERAKRCRKISDEQLEVGGAEL